MQPHPREWPNKKDRPFGPQPTSKTVRSTQRHLMPIGAGIVDLFRRTQDLVIEWDWRDGYFNAAENLAYDFLDRETIERGKPRREFNGIHLPLLYCYRHYLEVSLKHQVVLWSQVSRRRVAIDIGKEHGLMKLWNELEKHRKVFYGNEQGNDTIDSVERDINMFNMFDPSSQTFRYRRDQSGKLHDERIPKLELRKLMRAMRGLKHFFDAQVDVVDEIEKYQQDADQP
mgnify:CR=1 FL=1